MKLPPDNFQAILAKVKGSHRHFLAAARLRAMEGNPDAESYPEEIQRIYNFSQRIIEEEEKS